MPVRTGSRNGKRRDVALVLIPVMAALLMAAPGQAQDADDRDDETPVVDFTPRPAMGQPIVPQYGRNAFSPMVSVIRPVVVDTDALPSGTFIPLTNLSGPRPGADVPAATFVPSGPTAGAAPASSVPRGATPGAMSLLGVSLGEGAITGAASATARPAAPPSAAPSPAPSPSPAAAPSPAAPANIVVNSVEELTARFGVPARGTPRKGQLQMMAQALSLYPRESLAGMKINFTGLEDIPASAVAGQVTAAPERIAALWGPDGTIIVYGVNIMHQFAHEIGHHVLERTWPDWGQRVVAKVWELKTDYPRPPDFHYAVDNMRIALSNQPNTPAWKAGMDEVAAEVVSFFADGSWRPVDASLSALLREKITPRGQ